MSPIWLAVFGVGPALTALARMENMRSQSMGAIVGPMEEAGLIAGAPDPNDGRQTLLSVTALGQRLHPAKPPGARGLARRADRRRADAEGAGGASARAGAPRTHRRKLSRDRTARRFRRCANPKRGAVMAATTLDRKTALIVIDLQKGIVGMADRPSGRRGRRPRRPARRRVPPPRPARRARECGGRRAGPHRAGAARRRVPRRLDGACGRAEPAAAGPPRDQAQPGARSPTPTFSTICGARA